MSALKDIIKEEYNRLMDLSEKYEKELEKLPKGSISLKKIKNHDYYYRAYRKEDKVKFEYLGKEDSPKFKKIEEKLKRSKEIKSKLRLINADIKELSKSLSE